MARGRMLDQAFMRSKKLQSVSRHARLTYACVLPFLDRKGRIVGEPHVLMGTVFRWSDFSLQEIADGVTELANANLICLYAAGDDAAIIEYVGFLEHNRPNHKEGPSRLPGPEDAGVTACSHPMLASAVSHAPPGDSPGTPPAPPASNVERLTNNEEQPRARKRAGAQFDPLKADIPKHVDPLAWAEFVAHRREMHKKLTPTATTRLTALLERHPTDANAMLRRSVENSWTGVFPLDTQRARREPQAQTYADVNAADLLTTGDVNGRWNN